MPLIKALWRDFGNNPWLPRFTMPLILINVLGSIYGFYWYHVQLTNTPAVYWPFVPDSPLSTALFALALSFYLLGWRGELFSVVAMTAAIKYGAWAVLVIAHFWLNGGDIRPVEIILFSSHLGMVAQGLIYLRTIKWGWVTVLLVFGWMLLNDFMDYVLGLHPYLFMQQQLTFALLCATGLTFIIFLVLSLGRRRVPI